MGPCALSFCLHDVTAGDTLQTSRIVRVPAKDGRTGQDIQLQYTNQKVIGNGSFGVVYQAKLLHGGDEVAIKKVLQDKRYKVNRMTLTCAHDRDLTFLALL